MCLEDTACMEHSTNRCVCSVWCQNSSTCFLNTDKSVTTKTNRHKPNSVATVARRMRAQLLSARFMQLSWHSRSNWNLATVKDVLVNQLRWCVCEDHKSVAGKQFRAVRKLWPCQRLNALQKIAQGSQIVAGKILFQQRNKKVGFGRGNSCAQELQQGLC